MLRATSPAELRSLLHARRASRITIDGINGAGKTHLANELAAALGIAAVDLDDYASPDRGTFVANLDLAQLRNDLALKSAFLLAGVCMREVVSRLNLSVDASVYIKRIDAGKWSDEDKLVPRYSVEEHITRLRCEHEEVVSLLQEPRSFELDEEVIRYHVHFVPHEQATICYERSVA